MSSFARIVEMSEALESPLDEASQRRQRELIALIAAGQHIVLGARATMFYTRPRYTADVDYAVGKGQFAKIRTWFKRSDLSYEFNGEGIECPAIRVDVIDGSRNAVIEEVLGQARGIPSLEAVAALKYVAAIRSTRPYDRRQQDAADLAALVLTSGFDAAAFLALLVGPYEAERERAGRVLADIKAHRSFQL